MEVGGVLASSAGDALLDAGESMKCLAEVKDSLDIEVKQNFIDPLQNLCDKDLKEIQVRCDGLSLPAPQDSPQGSLTPGPGAACLGVRAPAACVSLVPSLSTT